MDHKLYLTDPGIFKKDNIFYFLKTKKEVTDTKITTRLNKYAVPPAWTSVWYSSSPRCHIQVHGIDVSGKKQYILSQSYINNSKSEKFNRMKTFVKKIHAFKKKIKLKKNVFTRESLIHLLFNLLIDTHIRVGNEIYADQNKTYGLTTLCQKHLSEDNGRYILNFVGKSKIKHTIVLPEEYNFYISKLKNNGGKYIFTYNNQIIGSEELNDYLKKHMGNQYTCKDFRTWSANIFFIKSFLKNSKQSKSNSKIILESIDESANQLGHTRSICKKSYISNTLIDYCTDSFEEAKGLSVGKLLTKVWSS